MGRINLAGRITYNNLGVFMVMPSPDWDMVTLKWAGAYLDGTPCTGALKLRYNGGVMLDDDAVTPLNIFPKELRVQLTKMMLQIDGEAREVGYAEIRVPASNDPDIQGAGGTYSLTEDLAAGGGRSGINFVADINAPDGVIWLNKVIPTTPSPGTSLAVVYYSDFSALQDRVWALESGGGVGGRAVESVNGRTGAVVLGAADVGAQTAGDYVSSDDTRLTDARTPVAHNHAQADVTGLTTALAGKASTSHTHTIANVTGLQSALDGKAPVGSGGGGVFAPSSSAVVYASNFATGGIVENTALGVYVCTGVGDEVKINAAITAVGRGHVQLVGKNFNIANPIRLVTGTQLSGEGLGTILTATADFNEGMVIFNDATVHATILSKMTLAGGRKAVHGIHYKNDGGQVFTAAPDTNPDPAHTVHDLFIAECGTSTFAGHGMWMEGANLRAGKYTNIRGLANSGCGLFVDKSVDCHYVNVDMGSSGKNGPAQNYGTIPVGQGIHDNGANNMYTSCKAWYSRGVGFYNKGSRNGYANCQAQDNYGAGFHFAWGKSSAVGCHADSSGQAQGAGGLGRAGFYVGAESVTLTGCSSYDRTGQAWVQQIGFQFTSGFIYGRVTGCITYNNAVSSQSGTPGAGTTVDIAADAGGK